MMHEPWAGGRKETAVGKRVFTLPDAAREAGVTEEELRRAIQDGLLLAHFRHNTGEYHLDEDELRNYMRRTRRDDTLACGRRKVILLVDDRARVADVVKLELGRDSRVEVRHVSWGRDAELALKNLEPALTLVGFVPPGPAGDEVLAAIRAKRGAGKGRVVAYCDHPFEILRLDPAVAARMDAVGADEWLCTASGTRKLMIRIYEILGLMTNTQVLRRQA
jgi:hypothetical protein